MLSTPELAHCAAMMMNDDETMQNFLPTFQIASSNFLPISKALSLSLFTCKRTLTNNDIRLAAPTAGDGVMPKHFLVKRTDGWREMGGR